MTSYSITTTSLIPHTPGVYFFLRVSICITGKPGGNRGSKTFRGPKCVPPISIAMGSGTIPCTVVTHLIFGLWAKVAGNTDGHTSTRKGDNLEHPPLRSGVLNTGGPAPCAASSAPLPPRGEGAGGPLSPLNSPYPGGAPPPPPNSAALRRLPPREAPPPLPRQGGWGRTGPVPSPLAPPIPSQPAAQRPHLSINGPVCVGHQ